jgi:predicted transcriptional regulator of viral defense system
MVLLACSVPAATVDIMGQRKTYRSELQACAVEQHGYVTTDDTVRLGIPDDVLCRLVEQGALVSVCDDLFRLDGVPRSRRRAYAEAVLRAGPDAYLSHDAVLALHDLTDHDPHRVRVGTPHPVTAPAPGQWPGHLEVLHRTIDVADLTTYRGIRSTTVARALLDCHLLIARQLLAAAADLAVDRGLLLRRERHAVLEALGAG